MIWLLFFYPLFAREIFIQPSHMENVEFQRHLIESPSAQSFSQFYQNQVNPFEVKLLEDSKKAQFEFLKGSLEEAKELFEKISEKRLQHSWNKKSRKIIHYAILRAAQLEKDPKAQNRGLKKAYLFAPQIPINTELFPPPFVAHYQSLKTSLKKQVWPLPQDYGNYTKLLVNGFETSMEAGFLRLEPGRHRFSFLSDTISPFHIVTETAELEKLKLMSESLEKHGCFSERAKELLGAHAPKARIPGKTCQSLAHLSMESPSTHKALQKASSLSHSSKGGIFQSKWFWVGVSVLAVGIAYHTLNQKSGSSPPHSAPAPLPVPSSAGSPTPTPAPSRPPDTVVISNR